MMIQAMDCNNIGTLLTSANSRLPELEKESIENYRLVGEMTKNNIEIENALNDIINNPDLTINQLKSLQNSILKLSEQLVRCIKVNDDQLMKDFLIKSNDIYLKLNNDLVTAILNKFNNSYTPEKHKEQTSKYTEIIEVYAND